MKQSIYSVVYAHDASFVIVAALVCAIGSTLTVVLLVRARVLTHRRRQLHLILAAMIAGTTIWATHFIAMLGYNPAGVAAYEPILTGVSLLVAIFGCMIGVSIGGMDHIRWRATLGGTTLGLTIATMHYTGMAALQVPGRFEWHANLVVLSVLLGCGLGIVMVHRIIYPVTRFCFAGATVAMILAVCTMHFTGMAASIFVADATILVSPENVISNYVLGFIVLAVVSLILLIGFTTFVIETEMSADSQRKLSDAVRRDLLTRLPNRMGFSEHAARLRKRISRGEVLQIAVLTIDLDNFKQINDSMGHEAGDLVLKHVAKQINGVIGDHEFVARIGGDEFAALKSNVKTLEDALDFAERLKTAIGVTLHVSMTELKTGVSIGIASYPSDETDLDTLLQFSDLAMYQAKSGSSNKIEFYDNEIEQVRRDKQALLTDLREAADRDELFLNYQFQNSIATQEVIGFEVLLRWLHPERGMIGPDVFIPLAEETGLIKDIGLWVLRTACQEAASWEVAYPIAVNVSPQQLVEPDFVARVAEILAESNLAPDRLEVEITEATIIQDQRNALAVMHELKSMGIRIAMDDFGTGYSSLSTLQVFPFDKIKIDRSFVQNVHESRQNAAIVRATLLLGAALDVPVLAEGAEIEEEIAFLMQETCSAVQGFYFGKPMPAADVRLLTMVKQDLPRAV
ncbi:diguanylate cyclase (GGDEF)-like protein [Loktanella ponticola]|uniref:Diguanylate cyclase (GGDEF)-like protein n=1 Tax=Yoonia ponticola TaxID=1524255 RepID=A0A7W9BL16_9RHOB|nr:EAL domain-containing protein [Yoonia ponticola]MBB5722024.1 diguanylate cyclase (GGDEF)-like protein [Yoonia ponticola]